MSKLTNSTEVSKEKVTVYSTRNYELFNPLKRNRAVSYPHVSRIVKSMKERVLFSPIVVNEHGFVIDGQHRLEACKVLKIPVKYVVMDKYSMDDVMSYNKSLKAWSNNDFIYAYAMEGRQSYVLLCKLIEKYNLNLTVASKFLGCGNNTSMVDAVRSGKYNNTETYEKADEYAKVFSDILSMTKKLGGSIHKTILAGAVKQLVNNDKYDHSRMIYKLNIYNGDMELASTMKPLHFSIWLNDVYNFKSKNKVNILKQ